MVDAKKRKRVFTERQVVELLRDDRGELTKKQHAEMIGVSAQYLGDVLHGRRSPGPAILDYLKLEKAYRSYVDEE